MDGTTREDRVRRNKPCTLTLANQELELRPTGTVFWAARKTLLISDLHLGKDVAFQRSAIPLPAGATTRTLSKWSEELQSGEITRCIILGDLLHSRIAHSETLERALDAFRERHQKMDFFWVLGNHDTSSRKWMDRWNWAWVGEVYRDGGICFVHDPLEEESTEEESTVEARVGGHWHPLVQMRDNGERLKCFYQVGKRLILPSFGELTFGKGMVRRPGDRIWGITGSEVVELPQAATSRTGW